MASRIKAPPPNPLPTAVERGSHRRCAARTPLRQKHQKSKGDRLCLSPPPPAVGGGLGGGARLSRSQRFRDGRDGVRRGPAAAADDRRAESLPCLRLLGVPG